MKLNKYKLVAYAAFLLSTFVSKAQDASTAYFLDDCTYRYQMNPAFANSRSFVSFPGLGNLNVSTNGTLGVKDVLYNVEGRTTTFMNPGVSTAEFLKNIKENNKISVGTNITALACGFKAFGGYNTITVSAKAECNNQLPGELFSLLKEGLSNKTYDIGKLHSQAMGYVDVGLGHSRNITDELRVGANIDVLVGIGGADINLNKAQLSLKQDKWQIISNATANAYLKNTRFKSKINESTGQPYINDIDIDDIKPNGFGLAVDLGAVYTPSWMPDLQISASLLDLGFIRWSTNVLASTQGDKTFDTDKYTFNVNDDAPNNFSDEFDKIKDDIAALAQLTDLGDQGTSSNGLGATLNVGARYSLPIYRRLAFGVLNTTRINGDFSWTDFRVSANWMAAKVFDAALSVGTGTFGVNMGWIANLHCTGFNFFIGMDKIPFKLTKDGYPMSANFSLNTGINFLF